MIKLNDRFHIEADAHSWVLVEHVANDTSHHRTKNPTREKRTFHGKLYQALQAAVDKGVKARIHQDEWDTTMAQLLAETLQHQFTSALADAPTLRQYQSQSGHAKSSQ